MFVPQSFYNAILFTSRCVYHTINRSLLSEWLKLLLFAGNSCTIHMYVVLVFLKRKYPTKYQQTKGSSVRAGFQVAVTGTEVVGAAHACVLQSFSSSGDPGQGMSVEEQSLFLFMSPPPHCLLHTVHGPHLLHSEYPVSSTM